MHASSLIVALLPLLALSTAQAHTITPPHMRHRRLANSVRHITDSEEIVPHALVAPRLNTGHAEAKKIIKKSVKKRGQQCRPRNPTTTSFSAAAATASSSSASDSSSSASDVNTLNNQAWAAHATSTYIAPTTTSSPAWAPTTTSSADWSQSTASSSASWSAPSASSGGSSSSGGVLSITDPTCGWCGANDDQPNGAIGWLNCGLDAGGWTPPHVTVDQLIAAELSSDGVFSPCASYIDKFNQYADQFGLKGIMLASFAMQESTCNPSATGGNGEAGLMQLAHENCHGAPGGNCYDVDFNIQRAAQLFSSLIDSNNGNVLMAIGSYNGWRGGMTIADATAAASQGRCQAQNNLDYLFQYTSGWMQGKNGYNIGQYFNLRQC